jgi:hypothetical protein
MYTIVSCVACFVLLFSSCAYTETTSNTIGDLEVKVLANIPVTKTSSFWQAACKVYIKNNGSDTLKCGMLSLYSLQLDNGMDFSDTNHNRITGGMQVCNDKDTCKRTKDQLTTIMPNQEITFNMSFQLFLHLFSSPKQAEYGSFSGSLFIMNQNTGKDWISTLSFTNKVDWNIH